MGDKLLLKLNIYGKPIANKYREGKMKRTLKRGDESAENIKEMIRKMEEREKSERKRYNQYYGIDLDDKKNYDIVIDTSDILPEKVIGIILGKIERKKVKV